MTIQQVIVQLSALRDTKVGPGAPVEIVTDDGVFDPIGVEYEHKLGGRVYFKAVSSVDSRPAPEFEPDPVEVNAATGGSEPKKRGRPRKTAE